MHLIATAPRPPLHAVNIPGLCVADLVLHVLGAKAGDHQDAQTEGAEDLGQPGIPEPQFEPASHGVGQ